ncbi:MAG: thermonuclease family protein [Candidatus Sericytochromatia bacterium]|nr:thermonuclease family protein [Candidatus Tanganyikabacteria bacterium]
MTDGDTVVVRAAGGERKVRLLGIDAPEKDQAPWGPRATAFLRQLVTGKAVRVETDVQPRDRYGRTLGYLYAGEVFVNLEMVRQGFAMLYTHPPNVAHTAALVAAQREAREAGRNIWALDGGLSVTPYEWRHNRPAPPKIGQGGLRAGRPGAPGTPELAVTSGAPQRPEATDTPKRPEASDTPNRPEAPDTPEKAEAQDAPGRAGPPTDPHRAAGVAGQNSDPAPPPIVGNRNSRKFHGATCPLGARMSARNRVGFGSAREAEAAGMTPCGRCKGR